MYEQFSLKSWCSGASPFIAFQLLHILYHYVRADVRDKFLDWASNPLPGMICACDIVTDLMTHCHRQRNLADGVHDTQMHPGIMAKLGGKCVG